MNQLLTKIIGIFTSVTGKPGDAETGNFILDIFKGIVGGCLGEGATPTEIQRIAKNNPRAVEFRLMQELRRKRVGNRRDKKELVAVAMEAAKRGTLTDIKTLAKSE